MHSDCGYLDLLVQFNFPTIIFSSRKKNLLQQFFEFFLCPLNFFFLYFCICRDLRYLLITNLRGEDDITSVLKECSYAGMHVLVRKKKKSITLLCFFFHYCIILTRQSLQNTIIKQLNTA